MVSILCVCGMGFGTSLMLKMTIDDILAANKIKAEVTAWDLGSVKGCKADLFVLSEDMKHNVEDLIGKVVFVKDLTNEKEVEEIVLGALKELSNG